MQTNVCRCTYVKNRHNLHKAADLKLNTTYRKVNTNTISCFQRSLEDTAGGTDMESLTHTDLKTCWDLAGHVYDLVSLLFFWQYHNLSKHCLQTVSHFLVSTTMWSSGKKCLLQCCKVNYHPGEVNTPQRPTVESQRNTMSRKRASWKQPKTPDTIQHNNLPSP